MKLLPLVIGILFILAGCAKSGNTLTGATTIEPEGTTVSGQENVADCKVAISSLEAELEDLKLEKEAKEEELGKKLREARAELDEQKLEQINEEIDMLAQRIKEIRKGLIPTLESQIAAKKKFCQ
ncbi:MAG TPA: hypothetical protein VJJ75_01890 [Candidatus Nanoarchaeia archaeon]|nr:hypothetical protein [Candidatus Nanoarchaeia archaeon]